MTHPLQDDLEHVLAHTETLWPALRGRRLFLTGGTGFFGCWLLESLLWINRELDLRLEVVVLSRDPAGFRTRAPWLCRDDALVLHQGEQTNFDFPSGVFHAVVHAAVQYGSPWETFDANVLGARRVLAFARQAGASRFLFTSSGAVYGAQPPEIDRLAEGASGSPALDEPGSAYGLAKRVGEHMGQLHQRAGGPDFAIARCFAALGPYQPLDRGSAIANFIGNALAGASIHVSGDGTPLRSYLYAADLTIWLWTILLRGVPGRPYNVGGSEAVSIAEVARAVRAVVAPEADVHLALQAAPDRRPSAYLPDVSRAQSELGLRTWIPLDEAIRRTARFARLSLQDRFAR